jgi:hypothetical protein
MATMNQAGAVRQKNRVRSMSQEPGIIRIMCPNLKCRSILGVPAEARGKLVRCKKCGTNIEIPQRREIPVEPVAPPADGAAPAPPVKKSA